MKIRNSFTTFSLLAALAAGEALAGTPQFTPAVMVSGPGMQSPATVQDVVYRRRRRRVVRTRSKKKSAAIVAVLLPEARPSERLPAVAKARESARSPEAEPGYYTTRPHARKGSSVYSTFPTRITSIAVSPIFA
jgi:hypothetical protein